MKVSKRNLNRREFLSLTTTAISVIAIGRGSSFSFASSGMTQASQTSRIGISDEAYAAAVVRAQALTAQMTLAEKISQLGDSTPAIDRLGIQKYNYYSNEALHGLCTGPQVTSFPVPLALAASWNPDLAHKVYTVVANECRAHDNAEHGGLSFYSPVTLNLHRDPRWGRCYEAPGEDPCLASTLAIEIVKGMQGDNPSYLKTTACSKHFICNNTDDDRERISATVDERSFWEFYTRAYRETVIHADVFTVMSAYNAVNGIPCSADHTLLTDILRGQWGFRGYVTSDCDAVKDIFDPHHYAPDLPTAGAMGIKAGCDLNCWGGVYQNYLQAAVDHALLTEEQIGQAVTRLITVRALLGTLDPPSSVPYTTITLANLPWSDHSELAIESARQSLVLLKNEGNFLPLDSTKVNKVAVIGPLGSVCHLGGYSGQPGIHISPLRGILERLNLPLEMDYIEGGAYTNVHGSAKPQQSPKGTSQLAYIKDGDWAEFKSIDFTGKTTLSVVASSATNGGTLEVHIDTVNGPLAATFAVANTGDWNNLKEMTAPITGITGVHDVFWVFKGDSNYLMNVERMTLLPVAERASESSTRWIRFNAGCAVTGDRNEDAFNSAVDSAKAADVVILVCGVDSSVSSEGRDRDSIDLTGAQPDLIKAVYAANPKTVLVLSSNNSVSIEWEQENLPAILAAICAGQAQGTAIAEALFGDFSPGGKLPCTWYRSLAQLPDKHDYDIHKGRTYQYFDGNPLYPFGYGLSYTSFKIDNLKAHAKCLGEGGVAKYSVTVTNVGNRKGAEVVQLYVVPPAASVIRPKRQLAGFQRVELKPGERKSVTFELTHDILPFWYWSETDGRFVCQPGTATIEVGNSSANLQLKADLTVLAAAKPLPEKDSVEARAVKSTIA